MFNGLPVFLQVVLAVGVIAAAGAYVWAQIRTGSSKAESEVRGILSGEIDILKTKVARLEADKRTDTAEINRLHGVVEQLQNENSELRALVMGEKVPEALAKALNEISQVTISAVERITHDHLTVYTGLLHTLEMEYLHPMLQRLERRRKDVPVDSDQREKS